MCRSCYHIYFDRVEDMQDIDVLGFANDRARDLGALQSMLAEKHAPLDCLRHPKKKQKIEAKRSVDSCFNELWKANPLPRHLRRRTTSHNRRCSRRGSTVGNEKVQSERGGERPNRRHRRRSTSLNGGNDTHVADSVSSKVHRLYAHVWHAKRFVMKEKWGWLLPHRRNDIGFRATVTAANQRCTVYDRSFYSIGELRCSSKTVLLRLVRLLVPLVEVDLESTWRSNSWKTLGVYMPGTHHYVGPVEILHRGNSRGEHWIWLIIHPAQLIEINEAVALAIKRGNEEGWKAEIEPQWTMINDEIAIFSLTGPSSIEAASHALRIDTKLLVPSAYTGDIFDVCLRDPRISLSKEDTGECPNDLVVHSREHRLESSASFSPDHAQSTSGILPVTVLTTPSFRQGRPGGEGVAIFMPKIWARTCWQALVKAKCVAIGLEDRHAYLTDHHQASFPEDFPDTAAGRAHFTKTSLALMTSHENKARMHRLNYFRLRVLSPFSPTWNDYLNDANADEMKEGAQSMIVVRGAHLQRRGDSRARFLKPSKLCAGSFKLENAFVHLLIRSCRKGVPSYGGTISLPPLYKGRHAPPLDEDLYGIEEPRGTQDDHLPTYKAIGFVTSGCRSLSSGQNVGIAICSFAAISAYVDEGGEYILFRNADSSRYWPAYFSTSAV